DVRERAVRAAALPLVPAEVVCVVSGHEDDHEQLRIEALGQPQRELDALLGDATHRLEVDAAVGRDGKRVIVRERAEARLELLQKTARSREAVTTAVGVEP